LNENTESFLQLISKQINQLQRIVPRGTFLNCLTNTKMKEAIATLKEAIREIPDFPKKGILFYDITTLLKNAEHFKTASDLFVVKYKDMGITKVVGIESRGFIMGGLLANRLNAGFVPIRKPKKLPAETYKKTYQLEYGEDTIEIHKDALTGSDVVLLHDDLLATGGTAKAAIDLIRQIGVKQIYVCFIIELLFLNGRNLIDEDIEVFSLIQY